MQRLARKTLTLETPVRIRVVPRNSFFLLLLLFFFLVIFFLSFFLLLFCDLLFFSSLFMPSRVSLVGRK